MKKLLSLFVMLLLLLTSCTAAPKEMTPLVRRTTPQPLIHVKQTEWVMLGSDGKLYVGGPNYLSNADLSINLSVKPLTAKQLESLPDEIKAVYDPVDNRIDGGSYWHLLDENVVELGANLFSYLTADGKFYNTRDEFCPEIGVPSLVSENVAKSVNLRMFIMENGDLVCIDSLYTDFDEYKEAESYTGVSGHKLVKIASNVRYADEGLYCIAYIDAYGQLWIAGYNDFGQLANGKYDDVYARDYQTKKYDGTPIEPEGYDRYRFYKVFDNAKEVYLFERNVFVIDTKGTLWGWGANEFGQVGCGTHGDGNPSTRDVVTKPKKILDNVTKLTEYGYSSETTGELCVVALTENGDLYGWGSFRRGVLGNGVYQKMASAAEVIEKKMFYDRPTLIMSDVKDYAYSRPQIGCFVLKTNGDLYAWGDTTVGSVGNGTKPSKGNGGPLPKGEFITQPVKIMEDVVLIGSVAENAVTSDGTVWVWGSNPFGWKYLNSREYTGETVGYLCNFASPTVNFYTTATVGEDGSISFQPTPTE